MLDTYELSEGEGWGIVIVCNKLSWFGGLIWSNAVMYSPLLKPCGSDHEKISTGRNEIKKILQEVLK